eukprot:NODE_7849_length_382_cov_160.246246_g6145_i0.p2 GENE.NODE_7849_length_382_cov_160.246246_g6145_i0~~NODE_7849_length_382_cov_160.246246_g6145_i0.p2  ORF type:complete len:109 (-),score=26.41 NODE_7849_length_382_cov_160.246246_g6145_i0:56-358(-)
MGMKDNLSTHTMEGVDEQKIPNRYKSRPVPISEEELDEWRVPAAKRDYCAHKYVELMQCFLKENDRPGSCPHQLHDYNKCQYLEIKRRYDVKAIREELAR